MKKILKENLFWVVLGASVILLLILIALFILPAMGKKTDLKEEIKNRKFILETIASGADKYSVGGNEKLKSMREWLMTDYKNVIDFYVSYDKDLECWFKELSDPPDVGFFDSTYKDHKTSLETSLRNMKIWSKDARSTPFNWGEERAVDNLAILKKIQKRFWVRERVTNTIKKGLENGLNIKLFKDIRFTERLDTAPSASSEYLLPDELGETLTFEISIEILYRDILKFISRYLQDPELKPKMLIKIRSCKIRMTEPMEEERSIEWDAEKEPVIEPNPMSLILTCEVIDFDIAKRKDFNPQQPKTQ